MSEEKCCLVTCENPIDQSFWDNQYQAKTIGWDLGLVSPPIKNHIDTLENKNISILIPGCGNSYEAEYLLEQGFTNITVIDIAPTLVESLKSKFEKNSNITIILGDFFEHQGQYDIIIEQTFFCALLPALRQKYVWKMHQLLVENGKIIGLLFNRDFENSPPFGGNKAEYEALFKATFVLNSIEKENNSVPSRSNSELFIAFQKSNKVVTLYSFQGITCSGCKQTVTSKFQQLKGVLNVNMSIDFKEILVISEEEIPLAVLENEIAYDANYSINKINYE